MFDTKKIYMDDDNWEKEIKFLPLVLENEVGVCCLCFEYLIIYISIPPYLNLQITYRWYVI